MNSYPSLVGSSIHSNWRWLEADWSELSSCWLSWTWVWLINEDKLGFPWTEMLDFLFFPFLQDAARLSVIGEKKNLCFWETQTLSSVFSIRTLKIIKQPCNAMSQLMRIPILVAFIWSECLTRIFIFSPSFLLRPVFCRPVFHLPVGGHT